MARSRTAIRELSEATRQALARHQSSDPLDVAARLAREILDDGLDRGVGFDRALGLIYLGGMQAYEERPRRGRKAGQRADGEEGEHE